MLESVVKLLIGYVEKEIDIVFYKENVKTYEDWRDTVDADKNPVLSQLAQDMIDNADNIMNQNIIFSNLYFQ